MKPILIITKTILTTSCAMRFYLVTMVSDHDLTQQIKTIGNLLTLPTTSTTNGTCWFTFSTKLVMNTTHPSTLTIPLYYVHYLELFHHKTL